MFEQISQLSLFVRLNAKLEVTEAPIVDLLFHCNHSFNPVCGATVALRTAPVSFSFPHSFVFGLTKSLPRLLGT